MSSTRIYHLSSCRAHAHIATDTQILHPCCFAVQISLRVVITGFYCILSLTVLVWGGVHLKVETYTLKCTYLS